MIKTIIKFSEFLLKTNEKVYSPQEDSFFLEDCLEKYFSNEFKKKTNLKSICEIGCGSGYITLKLINLFPDLIISAVDINENAVDLTKANLILNKVNTTNIKIEHSNLFGFLLDRPENLIKSFDLIVFNPPYIPSEEKFSVKMVKNNESKIESSWEGGLQGKEVINLFLDNASQFLNENGLIFILLTNYQLNNSNSKKFVEQNAKKYHLMQEYTKKINFESLFVLVLQKN